MLPSEQLTTQFLARHPEAAAEVLISLMPAQQAQALANLDIPVALAILIRLPAVAVARMLLYLEPVPAVALLSAMPLRNAADVLRRVETAKREGYLAALPVRMSTAVRSAIERVQDSVAALMDRHVVSFPVDTTVEQVIQRQDLSDSGCHIYVTDLNARFAGALSLRYLFACHSQLRVGSLPLQSLIALPEGARASNVIGHPAWLRFPQLPVVDASGRFVGVLRRERLAERSAEIRHIPNSLLGTGLALMEGYATANVVLLELLMQGPGKCR